MSRNYDLYLEDIVAAADRIASYVEGVTRSEFEADQMRIDAVIRNLGIIGEATKQIPDVIREKAPSIAWHNIAGLRNRVIHVSGSFSCTYLLHKCGYFLRDRT